MARRLLNEMDTDATVRAEAAEQLDDAAARASVLFLKRPQGWRQEFEEEVAEHRSQLENRSAGRERRRVQELERDLKAARAKAREALKRAQQAEVDAEARIAASRRDIKQAGKAASRRAAEMEAALRRSEALRQELVDHLAALQEELTVLRVQRRKRDDTLDSGVARPAVGSDRLSLARSMDDLLIRAQQHHEPVQSAHDRAMRLALPVGVAPDREDAVEWLLTSGVPQVWIVDGHNLAHRLDPLRFTDPQLRLEIGEAFGRLRRQCLGPFRAVIVFDTGAPVGDSIQAAPGIEVTFVSDADAEVVRLAAVHGAGAVVVSSDGEVRLDAETEGAVAIWSEAVVEFLGR